MIHLFTGRHRPVFYLILGIYILFASSNLLANTNVIKLEINKHTIHAEIAANDSSRARGLMFREQLQPNSGMLFVFEQLAMPCFWMKNTPLNLSIAFITDKGVITNIEHMQAQSLDSHCPSEPILYALEMEQGWFEGKAVAGDRVQGL